MTDLTDAPETELRQALAVLLGEWQLAVVPVDDAAVLEERGVKHSGAFPTALTEFTYLSSPPTTYEGRANALYRVQFFTRRLGGPSAVEAWAAELGRRLDQKEYLPNILGIGWAWETSRLPFDADKSQAAGIAVTYGFRGRRRP